MELNRKPTTQEKNLLEILIKKSSINIIENWKDRLLVRSMNDGQMGSLYLFPNMEVVEDRLLGDQVSELKFFDEDGIAVIATLNLDINGNLFELDIWKTDFSKLIKLPDFNQ